MTTSRSNQSGPETVGIDKTIDLVDVCAVADVKEGAYKLVRYHGTPVAVFRNTGRFFAIDNRCPHMGFPLCKGQVHEGIVVCPWHHWKFDLATGGCFTVSEYDATSYDVIERDGRLYLGRPVDGQEARLFTRYEGELREGLKAADSFQIAKAVTRYSQSGGDEARLVRFAAGMALQLQAGGAGGTWAGLTSLANVHHMSQSLKGESRTLGLVQAMREVARVISGAAPRRPVRVLEPLEKNDPDRLHRLLLYFADKRTTVGVERCLATLMAIDLPPATVAHWAFEAIGQHLYPSTGHTHDFLYRCFDLLDQIGWDMASTALGTLATTIADASWAEESEPWSPYVDRLFEIRDRLRRDDLRPGSGGIDTHVLGHRLAEDTRHEVLDALEESLQAGATAEEISRALNIGWMLRLARFSLVNETDWAQVFHGVVAADSIDQAIGRFGPSPVLIASVFDSAVALYLTQSLNIPHVRLPDPQNPGDLPIDDPTALLSLMADCLELRQPDRAGACVAHYIFQGHPEDQMVSALVAAMFREDGDFHTFQAMRATLNQFEALRSDPLRHLTLVGISRMFAAQRMQRNVLMSTQFALKLSKGEYLAGGDDHEE